MNQFKKTDPDAACEEEDGHEDRCKGFAFGAEARALGFFGGQCGSGHVGGPVAGFGAGDDFGGEFDDARVGQQALDVFADVAQALAVAVAFEGVYAGELVRFVEEFLGGFQVDPEGDIVFVAAFGIAGLDGEGLPHKGDGFAFGEVEAVVQLIAHYDRAGRNRQQEGFEGVAVNEGDFATHAGENDGSALFGPLHFLLKVGQQVANGHEARARQRVHVGLGHKGRGVLVGVEVVQVLVFGQDEKVEAEVFHDFAIVVFQRFHLGLRFGFFDGDDLFGAHIMGLQDCPGANQTGDGDGDGQQKERCVQLAVAHFLYDESPDGHGMPVTIF